MFGKVKMKIEWGNLKPFETDPFLIQTQVQVDEGCLANLLCVTNV